MRPALLELRPERLARDLVSGCPRSGGGAEERRERPPGRDRAPQKPTPARGPREIAVVGCGFRGVGEMGCMGAKDPSAFSAGALALNAAPGESRRPRAGGVLPPPDCLCH